MIASKKSLSRRTFLRGVGATMALPLLDSMVPAFATIRDTAANPVSRLGAIYIPHGAVLDKWIPTSDGADYEMSPTLKTLAAFRDDVLVITNLENTPALVRAGEPLGGHANIMGAWLSGVHAKPTEGADVLAGVTMDQLAARHFEKDTQLASLELGIEPTDLSGSCDVGFSCAYINTVSWRSPTTPLPVENNPRALFERLFGDSDTTDAGARLKRIKKDRSILDSVHAEVASLRRKLGLGDRSKLTEYLEAVRDIERRIQKAEEQGDRDLPLVERPTGAIPETFAEHVKLMMDLQVLAYQTDMTRVITFMMSKDITNRTYPEIGVRDPHHPLSHHQNKPESLEKLAKINVFHLEMFAYYLEKLQSTPDGDGSLLDHIMLLYGSGMGDSNAHTPRDLPILLAGGGTGQIKGGRHIRVPEGTPLSNLYLTMLNKLGVRAESIGDSTGQMHQLSSV
ncbi:MAG: DUF1552 domain-containing protein [Candidatus Hydrogenedentes bacterium]|nr:DUF1552 domain-containing protein [Candidatus Hydrogenedentota bacterium]